MIDKKINCSSQLYLCLVCSINFQILKLDLRFQTNFQEIEVLGSRIYKNPRQRSDAFGKHTWMAKSLDILVGIRNRRKDSIQVMITKGLLTKKEKLLANIESVMQFRLLQFDSFFIDNFFYHRKSWSTIGYYSIAVAKI